MSYSASSEHLDLNAPGSCGGGSYQTDWKTDRTNSWPSHPLIPAATDGGKWGQWLRKARAVTASSCMQSMCLLPSTVRHLVTNQRMSESCTCKFCSDRYQRCDPSRTLEIHDPRCQSWSSPLSLNQNISVRPALNRFLLSSFDVNTGSMSTWDTSTGSLGFLEPAFVLPGGFLTPLCEYGARGQSHAWRMGSGLEVKMDKNLCQG